MLTAEINSNPLQKNMVFITGAPRSGTSMLTKVLDAHKDIAILMENNFGNRRRHWLKSNDWDSHNSLSRKVCSVYESLKEPVIGNKICTPDVWWKEDILQFCALFGNYRIIFMIRDPANVARSRYFREDYSTEFNKEARQKILLDFSNQFLTYTSSWRQSIDVYRQLSSICKSNITLVYYEDFINSFESECRRLTDFLELPFDDEMLRWNDVPHHDRNGVLKRNLKYTDVSVDKYVKINKEIPESQRDQFDQALASIDDYIRLWQSRSL